MKAVLSRMPKSEILFGEYGDVLKDYANALKAVNRNLKHLRQDMLFTQETAGHLRGDFYKLRRNCSSQQAM